MSAVSNRREALRTAALAAGAAAAGGLLRPMAAAAQSEDQEAFRDFLVEAIALEQISVLAYDLAAEGNGVNPQLSDTFLRLRDQEQAHATAFRTALDSIGFDAPDPPDTTEDTGVLDDVEGLESERATELKSTLADLGDVQRPEEYVKFLIGLEQDQIDYYLAQAPGLDSEDLPTTCAEIVANQAQHLVILRLESGGNPTELLSGFEPPASAQE